MSTSGYRATSSFHHRLIGSSTALSNDKSQNTNLPVRRERSLKTCAQALMIIAFLCIFYWGLYSQFNSRYPDEEDRSERLTVRFAEAEPPAPNKAPKDEEFDSILKDLNSLEEELQRQQQDLNSLVKTENGGLAEVLKSEESQQKEYDREGFDNSKPENHRPTQLGESKDENNLPEEVEPEDVLDDSPDTIINASESLDIGTIDNTHADEKSVESTDFQEWLLKNSHDEKYNDYSSKNSSAEPKVSTLVENKQKEDSGEGIEKTGISDEPTETKLEDQLIAVQVEESSEDFTGKTENETTLAKADEDIFPTQDALVNGQNEDEILQESVGLAKEPPTQNNNNPPSKPFNKTLNSAIQQRNISEETLDHGQLQSEIRSDQRIQNDHYYIDNTETNPDVEKAQSPNRGDENKTDEDIQSPSSFDRKCYSRLLRVKEKCLRKGCYWRSKSKTLGSFCISTTPASDCTKYSSKSSCRKRINCQYNSETESCDPREFEHLLNRMEPLNKTDTPTVNTTGDKEIETRITWNRFLNPAGELSNESWQEIVFPQKKQESVNKNPDLSDWKRVSDLACDTQDECMESQDLARLFGDFTWRDLGGYDRAKCCGNHPHLKIMVHAMQHFFESLNYSQWFLDDSTLLGMMKHRGKLKPWSNVANLAILIDNGKIEKSKKSKKYIIPAMHAFKQKYVSSMIKFNRQMRYRPYVLRLCMKEEGSDLVKAKTRCIYPSKIPSKSKTIEYFVVSHMDHDQFGPMLKVTPYLEVSDLCLKENRVPFAWVSPTVECPYKFYSFQMRCPRHITRYLDATQPGWRTQKTPRTTCANGSCMPNPNILEIYDQCKLSMRNYLLQNSNKTISDSPVKPKKSKKKLRKPTHLSESV